jgi:hypothetical protein
VRPISWSTIAVRNGLRTSSVIVRRSLLEAAGEFDTDLKGSEERDLWLRIAEISSAANLDLPLVGWGVSAGSLGLQPEKCQAGMLRTLRKLDERGVWKGRHWLRRRAYGYCYNAIAYIYITQRLYVRAVENLLRSLAWYPFPFGRDDVPTRFERPKRLMVAGLRLLRLKAHEPRHPRGATSAVGRLSVAANE